MSQSRGRGWSGVDVVLLPVVSRGRARAVSAPGLLANLSLHRGCVRSRPAPQETPWCSVLSARAGQAPSAHVRCPLLPTFLVKLSLCPGQECQGAFHFHRNKAQHASRERRVCSCSVLSRLVSSNQRREDVGADFLCGLPTTPALSTILLACKVAQESELASAERGSQAGGLVPCHPGTQWPGSSDIGPEQSESHCPVRQSAGTQGSSAHLHAQGQGLTNAVLSVPFSDITVKL